MDSKMIKQKAREYAIENDPDTRENGCGGEYSCDDFYKGLKKGFIAGATLMSDRVKELELTCGVRGYDGLLKQLKEYEQQAKDNEGKDNIIIAELRQQLNEAVEIIKTISKNANHYDKIDLENKAEQFLSSLDKLKEDK